jgi:hypothetical protein
MFYQNRKNQQFFREKTIIQCYTPSENQNDPTISGIQFNDSEYLAIQYADDTSLTLEDDAVSLERCLQIFDKFFKYCMGIVNNLI